MAETAIQLHVGRSPHAIFREQLHGAPDGCTYVGAPELRDGGPATVRLRAAGSPYLRLRAAAEPLAVRALAAGGHVRRARVAPCDGAELIHSAQILLRDPPLPYVVDFEQAEVFSLYQRAGLDRRAGRDRLARAVFDERCRALLPWSEFARRSLLSSLEPAVAVRIEQRTTVVRPAIRPVAERPRERGGGPLRVLFVGTSFLPKGGAEAVAAVGAARASHDIRLDVVSHPGGEWARRLSGQPGVTVHRWPAPGGLVRELFASAHALLFPSHVDTLGFVVMEAMANGMPVLAADHHALGELVLDGESGLLFAGEEPLYLPNGRSRFAFTIPLPRSLRRSLARPSDAYVRRIADALVRLSEDGDLYGRLAAGGLRRVTEGDLSMPRRRQVLGEVYRRALGT